MSKHRCCKPIKTIYKFSSIDWWEELLLREPRFNAEIAQARQSLKQRKGISIEELRAKYTD